MRVILLLFFLFFNLGLVQSQNCDLIFSGYVKDIRNSSPLKNATIQIQGIINIMETNSEGYFEFQSLCPKNYSLIISHPNGKTKLISVELDQSIQKTIELDFQMNELDEVIVEGESNLKSKTIFENKISDEIIKDNSSSTLGDILKNISYCKNINTDLSYISIHIRTTDKLNNRGKDEFTYAFFIEKLQKTITYLNSFTEEMYIFVASDDTKYKKYLLDNLNKNYYTADPFLNTIDDDIYKDYFSLVHSKKIIMVPKFSSFAASASLLGNNILLSHCNENETSLYRYKCNIEYL